jgi:hypothetical protein
MPVSKIRRSIEMDASEPIHRLGVQLLALADEHPRSVGVLRISPTIFANCTPSVWEKYGWTVSSGEAARLRDGSEGDRLATLLRLLHPHGIRRVEYVGDVNWLEVAPWGKTAAA